MKDRRRGPTPHDAPAGEGNLPFPAIVDAAGPPVSSGTSSNRTSRADAARRHRHGAPLPRDAGRLSRGIPPRFGRRLQDLGQEALRPLVRRVLKKCSGVPASMIRPSSIITTRSATSRAKPISWLTTIIVMPSRASSFITSRTSPIISGSSALVGSSNSISAGLHRERAGDRDALLLAAGELRRVGVGLVREADPRRAAPARLDRLVLGHVRGPGSAPR